jgi:hypothetical protein
MLNYHQTLGHHVVGLLTLSIGKVVEYLKMSVCDFQRMHTSHFMCVCDFYVFTNMIGGTALCYSMMSLCIIVLQWYLIRTELQTEWMERRRQSSPIVCSTLSECECQAYANTSKFSTELIIANHISFLQYLLSEVEVCLPWWALLDKWLICLPKCCLKYVLNCEQHFSYFGSD